MNQLVVVLVMILLPGIIATIISDKLTTHSKWDSFKFGLYAFTLGVLTYATLQLIVYLVDMCKAISLIPFSWTNLAIWNSALNGGAGIKAWEICVAVFLSVPVAFFASWTINFKLFNKFAQKINVSTKYGDENLYSYYLNAEEIDWIYVRDPKNNFTYQGRVVSHSENDKVQEIVLSEVSVYRYEDSVFLYSVPTIYISREMGQLVIEAIPTDRLGETSE
ncbi:hypothetical protein KO507_15560 [Gilvimarinus agarilyticus]|uniref:hypothetical protein n=1 Tax=Gilvimarinus sp. 2_MG-2023 TaxID=3062666 RepID=UPI001C08712E|nr:hypothetical protein [Gilvimarinus sp. 2_MG-2023]MBU2887183.1 hypothetical protein [Gilvimarinus agarilyticus]MDO6571842.1 hypothetical protein [Gilvimarinus sp. 2_MG-2023]